ncbi:MAG: type II secretion system protein [Clostridium sp.]
MRKVEEKGKYSLLEMILVFTIIALVLSTAIIPAMKRARESARKVNDIATAKTIYTTTYEGLLTDKIDYPDKDIFIVVETSSEVSPGLNSEYRKSVLNYLHDNMTKVPYNTSLDKTKKFLIKIQTDGEVSIYVGSYFGDRVYPNPTGAYEQK